MTEMTRASAISGKTIRFIWTDGPTKGKIHEHVFHQDGTVEWHDAATSGSAKPATPPQKGPSAGEKPEYAAIKVADDIYAVSYLAPSGYTLTVVLNFHNRKIVGFASGAKDWHPVRGTFEVVE